MARKKKAKGNLPELPRRLIGSNALEGRNWELWERTSFSNETWRSLKLISLEYKRGRANYWFGWHRAEKRLTWHKDVLAIQNEHPMVHRWVLRVLLAKGK